MAHRVTQVANSEVCKASASWRSRKEFPFPLWVGVLFSVFLLKPFPSERLSSLMDHNLLPYSNNWLKSSSYLKVSDYVSECHGMFKSMHKVNCHIALYMFMFMTLRKPVKFFFFLSILFYRW